MTAMSEARSRIRELETEAAALDRSATCYAGRARSNCQTYPENICTSFNYSNQALACRIEAAMLRTLQLQSQMLAERQPAS